MKFELNDKISIKNCNLDVEICSKMPGAQGVKLDMGNMNFYGVLINGIKTHISEEMLGLFLENSQKEEEKFVPKKETLPDVEHKKKGMFNLKKGDK